MKVDLVAGIKKKKKKRERPEMTWEGEVNRALKQKNLTREEAVDRQIWRKSTENR
jgi:hypothetical protein